jgi:SAM-dependent methyltransferase
MSKDIKREIGGFAETMEPGKEVLDIGCGLRPYENFFSKHKYTGIDVEASGRKETDKKPDKYYDGLNIPYPDSSFDVAICTEVLEHCIDPDKLLFEIHRILRKDGQLFFTMPFIWGEHETPYDFRRFTSFGLKRKMEEVGFKIIEQRKLTTGIKAIERLVSSEITAYKNTSGYTPNPWQKLKEFAAKYLWLLVLRLWGRTYSFERVYINNLVIAKK